jgi:hypothetical protein
VSSSSSSALRNSKNDGESDNDDGVIEYDDFDGFNIGDGGESLLFDNNSRANQQQQPLSVSLDEIQRRSKFDLPDFDDDDDEVRTSSNNSKENEDVTITKLSELLKERKRSGSGKGQRDLTAVTTRQFSLGPDIILTDFVGNLGFDEVTDWEYYYEEEEDKNERQVVQPNPFDSSKPKRTRMSSGSVVRLFRGEFAGRLGATLRSKGLDRRILVREYTGKLGLALAEREQAALSRLQSDLVDDNSEATGGDWIQAASSRSVLARKDDSYVGELLSYLRSANFVGSFGEVNLAELEGEMEPNDFYRALGVPPPKPEAVWIVYEYVGLNTVASYAAVPPEVRRAQLPPKKTLFGFQDPAPLPVFRARANYVINGIIKGMVESVARIHESGLVHRSISGNSFVLTAIDSQDKREPSTVYFTRTASLRVKLQDFGFSSRFEEISEADPEFISRARSFGFSFRRGEQSLDATNFAMAEDMYALGFVVLGLLLTSLSEAKEAKAMPQTDEDTLQRLLGEIFKNDFSLFREYVQEDDCWNNLVELLDENEGAGWNVLETLFSAREKVAATRGSSQMVTARGLLSNPFFQPIRC